MPDTARKMIQEKLIRLYHFFVSKLFSYIFGNPSDKMIVIFVTGTKGKFSTVRMIAQLLESLNQKVGYISGVEYYIDGKVIEDNTSSTMPGHFKLQKILRMMQKLGCKYVVMEAGSAGIRRYRYLGINYDVVTYTNLTSEHIGEKCSFEDYKKLTSRIFDNIFSTNKKIISGKQIQKISVINADDYYAPYFLNFKTDKSITYSEFGQTSDEHIVIKKIENNYEGLRVAVCGEAMLIPYIAKFQQQNAVSALSVVCALGFSTQDISRSITDLESIGGRFEKVDRGQNFSIIVDFADEPYAVHAILDSIMVLLPNRIIGVHGADKELQDSVYRRKIGNIIGEHEDIVIITNNDPQDLCSRDIIMEMANGAIARGMQSSTNLFVIEDRKSAIEKAISLARKNDVVLVAGRGSETMQINVNGKKINWNDRDIIIESLKKNNLCNRQLN